MAQQVMGYLLGGFVPAILLGIYSVLQKAATKQGISPGMLLIVIGLNIVIAGVLYNIIFKGNLINLKSGLFAALSGIVWAGATCLIAVALSKFGMPISKLVPLFNMNTLVAVFLGLFCFAEFKNVNLLKITVASLLIIIGGTLASNS